MATHFWHGIMVGFAICIPVGPIAVLILRRTVADGRVAGFVSGLGAAMADALIGAFAVLFLAALMPVIEEHRGAIQLVGGAFIISMGVFILRTPPKIRETKRPIHERNLLIAFFSTCVLTISNPITILSTTGIVAATGMSGPETTVLHSAMLVLGIFTASTAWWVFICTCAHWLAQKLGNGFVRTINLIAAVLIIGFGVYLIADQISDKTTGRRLRPKRRAPSEQIISPAEQVRLPDAGRKPGLRRQAGS
jgi:threonine/homoserine/homoserine lactone efflux protein